MNIYLASQLARYMGQSNTRSACMGLFDNPMLLVLMAQSHACMGLCHQYE